MEEKVPAMSLKELREASGKTQADLAAALQIRQASVSELEARGDEIRLSTLRRYVEALGGRVELNVKLGGTEMRVALGVEEK
jgi:transcriptional regulator with XRE-family HTH domain